MDSNHCSRVFLPAARLVEVVTPSSDQPNRTLLALSSILMRLEKRLEPEDPSQTQQREKQSDQGLRFYSIRKRR